MAIGSPEPHRGASTSTVVPVFLCGAQCTAAQERDLEAMVQKAIEAWVVKHNISITAWSFDGVRNETAVPDAS